MGFKAARQLKNAYMSALIADREGAGHKGRARGQQKPARPYKSVLEIVAVSSSRKSWLKAVDPVVWTLEGLVAEIRGQGVVDRCYRAIP